MLPNSGPNFLPNFWFEIQTVKYGADRGLALDSSNEKSHLGLKSVDNLRFCGAKKQGCSPTRLDEHRGATYVAKLQLICVMYGNNRAGNYCLSLSRGFMHSRLIDKEMALKADMRVNVGCFFYLTGIVFQTPARNAPSSSVDAYNVAGP